MAKKLENLKITSVDAVDQGANPDAFVRLFKRKDGDGDNALQKTFAAFREWFSKGESAETFDEKVVQEKLREVTRQAWGYSHTLADSFCSIIMDSDLSDEDRKEKMSQSLDEFTTTLRGAIPHWAAGRCSAGCLGLIRRR